MSVKETMTDTAFHYMSKKKKEIEFVKLWQEVAKILEIPEERLARKKAQFYSELMLDNRFASLKGNLWDLRSRRKFDEFHVNIDIDDNDEDELLDIEDPDAIEYIKMEEDY